jgi:hypothetical protein
MAGDFERSEIEYQRSSEMAMGENFVPWYGHFLILAGCALAYEKKDYAGTLEKSNNLNDYLEIGFREHMPDVMIYRAKAMARLGRLEEANGLGARAVSEAEQMNARFSLLPAYAFMGDLEKLLGKEPESAMYLEKARELAGYLASQITDPALLDSFNRLPVVVRVREGKHELLEGVSA